MHPSIVAAALAVLLGAPWGAGKSAREVFDSLDQPGPAEALAAGKGAETPGDYAWGESYLLSAYVEMYEATGDAKYLDTFVSRYRVLLSLRDDKKGRTDEVRGRTVAGWGTTGYSKGKRTCWVVHAGMLTAPAARFVRLVKERRRLRGYRKTAGEFAAALEETAAAFESDWKAGPNPDEGCYMEPCLGKYMPLNQQNALGCALLDLAAATGKKQYQERAAAMARFFKRRLQLTDNGAYRWSYWPNLEPPYAHGSEDISHAAINVAFAVRCYENKVVFTKEEIERFAATFLKVVHRGGGRFADDVGGGGKGVPTYSQQAGRWGVLAGVNPEVARVIRDYFFRQDPPLAGPTTLLALAYLAHHGH